MQKKAEAAAQRKKKEPSLVAPVEEPKQRERSASSGSAGSEEKNGRSNEFPSQPVGVKASSKRNGKNNKKVNATVQLGTEQGRTLFQLLVSEPTTDKVPDSISSGRASPGATDNETRASER